MITSYRWNLVITIVAFASIGCASESTDETPQAMIAQAEQVPAAEESAMVQIDRDTINAMGDECAEKIGVIHPFSCLSGEIIPIFVDGVRKPGRDPLPDGCDQPSWLGGKYASGCKPNARLGRLPNLDAQGNPDDDVQNIFICRRYSYVQSPDDPYFEDVAIIQHRKSTGDSCYFQHEPSNLKSGGTPNQINASRVPPPNEREDATPSVCSTPSDPDAPCATADEFWLKPSESAAIECHNCHAAGPFLRSPYVSQVMKDNEPVLYPPSTDASNNFRFVGFAFEDWNPPQYVAPKHNPCVACHVAGYGKWYSRLLAFAVGQTTPPPGAPEHCQGTKFYPPFSTNAKQFPTSHWMPPNFAHNVTLEQWNALYAAAVSEIMACLPTTKSNAECMAPTPGPAPSEEACNIQTFGDGQ